MPLKKSLDSYKFNLLHNKQLFIDQLKSNNLGKRTIDEGGMDEKSGMNFSEYVAILMGNTDLLDKAKIEKQIAGLESERQSFNRSKSSAKYKLEDYEAELGKAQSRYDRMSLDWNNLQGRIQKNTDGSVANLIKLDVLSPNADITTNRVQSSISLPTNPERWGIMKKSVICMGFQLFGKNGNVTKRGGGYSCKPFFYSR
ncbi:hypothetical protein [Sphingobacterium daejeonense]|uniref:hypothetical protein n=1 Tax=Sphingobacterium daejeonense TaxID=371142 RepID=UPI0010C31A5B|nr:DNA methylase [Sphingobacterium daejeonense]